MSTDITEKPYIDNIKEIGPNESTNGFSYSTVHKFIERGLTEEQPEKFVLDILTRMGEDNSNEEYGKKPGTIVIEKPFRKLNHIKAKHFKDHNVLGKVYTAWMEEKQEGIFQNQDSTINSNTGLNYIFQGLSEISDNIETRGKNRNSSTLYKFKESDYAQIRDALEQTACPPREEIEDLLEDPKLNLTETLESVKERYPLVNTSHLENVMDRKVYHSI